MKTELYKSTSKFRELSIELCSTTSCIDEYMQEKTNQLLKLHNHSIIIIHKVCTVGGAGE